MTNVTQLADVNVHYIQDNGPRNRHTRQVLLQVEVDSNPSNIQETIHRAIYGAADLLCLFRHAEALQGKELLSSKVVSFVFPRRDKPSCVTKVVVKWENVRFSYNLELYSPRAAWREVRNAIAVGREECPYLPLPMRQGMKYCQ